MGECRLYFADTDMTFTDSLARFFDNKNDYKVVGVAHNGLRALDDIRNKKPDVVIMNLLLPTVDGLSLLKAVQKLSHPPSMICCSEFYSKISIESARSNGAEFYLLKPIEFTSLLDIVDECSMMRRNEQLCAESMHIAARENSEYARIRKLMHALGFSSRLSGCKYISESVILSAHHSILLRNMSKGLYSEIAIRLNSTPSRIERSMRTAIHSACKQGKLFHQFGGVPSNKECINYLLSILNSEAE